ncbi:amidohydrolase family protein [Virgibacillus sp. CBA3643]|uniref:amidohydrolase family protein n=1 Tax=Virgibacillus sp. CBA3643 TaxID=2942278 RepID=UPI0035A39F62
MNYDKYGLNTMIQHTPIFSTHEHHREDDFHTKLNLDEVLRNSYVGWLSPGHYMSQSSVPGDSEIERKRWLDTVRTNSYFVWLEKSINKIYQFEEINEKNWDDISETISKSHQDPSFHLDILEKEAKYKRFVVDYYWDPGHNLSHPDYVSSAYRMDSWLFGFHSECAGDHENVNPRDISDEDMKDLDAYEDAIRSELDKKKEEVVAFKCTAAYSRSLSFARTKRSIAEKIFGRHPDQVSEEEKMAFSNYMFHFFLEVARERDLPIQIHTGLGKISGSNPMLLEPVIANNPDVKFVLFHGGFPWIYETAGLAHNYKNVYLDINWLPLISTKAAEIALHTYLEVIPSNSHISWGGDNWTSEESVGASMAFRHVVTKVLNDKIDNSFYRLKDAEDLIEKLFFRNAEELYIR